MDAPATNTKIAMRDDVIRLVGMATLALFTSLFLVSLLVIVRRAAGELQVVGGWPVVLYSLLLPLAAWSARWKLLPHLNGRAAAWLLGTPTLALVSFAFAFTNLSTGGHTLLIWLLVLAEEAYWWCSWLQITPWKPYTARQTDAGDLSPIDAPSAISPLSHAAVEPEKATRVDIHEDALELALGPYTTQLLERTESDQGESISGQLRIRFAPTEQIQDLHLAFCPPLATTPRAELWCLSGVECRIKLVEACTYGIHAEVRRPSPLDSPAEVVLQLIAAEDRGDAHDEVGG